MLLIVSLQRRKKVLVSWVGLTEKHWKISLLPSLRVFNYTRKKKFCHRTFHSLLDVFREKLSRGLDPVQYSSVSEMKRRFSVSLYLQQTKRNESFDKSLFRFFYLFLLLLHEKGNIFSSLTVHFFSTTKDRIEHTEKGSRFSLQLCVEWNVWKNFPPTKAPRTRWNSFPFALVSRSSIVLHQTDGGVGVAFTGVALMHSALKHSAFGWGRESFLRGKLGRFVCRQRRWEMKTKTFLWGARRLLFLFCMVITRLIKRNAIRWWRQDWRCEWWLFKLIKNGPIEPQVKRLDSKLCNSLIGLNVAMITSLDIVYPRVLGS